MELAQEGIKHRVQQRAAPVGGWGWGKTKKFKRGRSSCAWSVFLDPPGCVEHFDSNTKYPSSLSRGSPECTRVSMEAVCDAILYIVPSTQNYSHQIIFTFKSHHLRVWRTSPVIKRATTCGSSGRTTSTVATRFKTQSLNISQISPVNVIKTPPTFYSLACCDSDTVLCSLLWEEIELIWLRNMFHDIFVCLTGLGREQGSKNETSTPQDPQHFNTLIFIEPPH